MLEEDGGMVALEDGVDGDEGLDDDVVNLRQHLADVEAILSKDLQDRSDLPVRGGGGRKGA